MLGRRDSPLSEKLSVAVVEAILSEASERAEEVPVQRGRAVADRAVWFCVCMTESAAAPTWLLYDTAEGGFGWSKDDGDRNISDRVDARELWGDHVHPAEVAKWLNGADPAEVFDVGGADLIMLRDLGRRVRELQRST
ncbi:hypothetical protein ASE01_20705 [Nocardioides sp. Root190]|uniref:hypothetical protein n=1 Tax=Nocardioides sp. Root190 TaxID=1736488 RepID=UPI0006F9D137|nr:hypothetical protein [Nocardioides sp. Root190]KRB73184.1 hypothetical protein ASE01_20705 [Nocardioides sp. Root190]